MCCLYKSKLKNNTQPVFTFSKSTVGVISSKFKKYRERWNRFLHSFLVLLLLLRASKYRVNRYYKKVAWMEKQQYINILETVVLRSPDKTQEFSLLVKTINSSAVSFQGFCLHFPSFCFQEYLGIASFIRNFHQTIRQSNICSEATIGNQEKGKRHFQS